MKTNRLIAPWLVVLTVLGSAHFHLTAQDQLPTALSRGAKPFDPADPAIFGGIPKEIFPTRVLYNAGPTFMRSMAITNDGGEFKAPLTRGQWRQLMFELSRHRLYTNALPEYIAFLTKARGFRWDHSFENGEPILLADVNFEWLADDLDHNAEVEKKAEQFYTLREGVHALATSKGRFFSAALVPEALCSPLVTLFLSEDFVFANTGDPISGADLQIDKSNYVIAMGGSLVADLGDREGPRTVRLIAHHRSGKQSKACFELRLQKANGAWLNTKAEDGKKAFRIKQLPPVHYTPADNHR